MTVVELKEKIIARISETDNEELLEHISDLIDFEVHSGDVHEMSIGEIEAVEDGIRQIENGQYIPHEEVKKRMDEWLKK